MKGDIITYGLPYEDDIKYSCRNYVLDLFLALSIGILLSPWKVFLILFVFGFLVYELGFYFIIQHCWYPDIRAGIILAYILGWIIGRTLIGYDDIASEDMGFGLFESVLLPPLNFSNKK